MKHDTFWSIKSLFNQIFRLFFKRDLFQYQFPSQSGLMSLPLNQFHTKHITGNHCCHAANTFPRKHFEERGFVGRRDSTQWISGPLHHKLWKNTSKSSTTPSWRGSGWQTENKGSVTSSSTSRGLHESPDWSWASCTSNTRANPSLLIEPHLHCWYHRYRINRIHNALKILSPLTPSSSSSVLDRKEVRGRWNQTSVYLWTALVSTSLSNRERTSWGVTVL